jgi:hypothetical protein
MTHGKCGNSTLASIGTCDLHTGQPTLTFTVIVTVALPSATGPRIAAVIVMTHGKCGNITLASIGTCDLHTGQPTLAFTVIITVSLPNPTGPKITAVIVMTNRLLNHSRWYMFYFV